MSAAASRFYALDLVRLLAALMVLVSHWGFVFPAWYLIFDSRDQLPFAEYGLLGVELFFLISGFVIMQSAEGKTAGAFIRARALRLYPMFWVCCTLTSLAIADFTGYWANLTMLPKLFDARLIDGVYWTLPIELNFYALVALALALGLLKYIEALLWLWLALTALPTSSMPLVVQFGAFFIGGVTCFLLARERRPRLLMLLLLSAASGIHQAIVHLTWQLASFRQPFEPVIVGTLVTLFYVALYAVAVGWIHVKPSRLVVSLGALTYPLYLLHNEIGKLFMAMMTGTHAAVLAQLFVGVLLLAYLLHRIVDRLVLQLRRRWPRREARPAVAPAIP